MSSEEKEPYFDGPLVTPTAGQALFYPNASPQHNFGQVPAGAAGYPQQGPAFYNPNDFMQAAARANPWDQPPAAQESQPHAMNLPPDGNVNTEMPGTQSYFGGVETSSSATSSQQTSPEHVPQPKLRETPFNSAPYEPPLYSSNASALFTPQVDGATSQSQILNPGAHDLDPSFSPPGQKMHNATFPPGGASGQHNYAHPPASSFFVPSSGPTNPEIQDYMNPVPHGAPTQHASFLSDTDASSSRQPVLPEQHFGAEALKHESTGLSNPFDLHNGTPIQTELGNDRSYMNMAYNHEYSGVHHTQGHMNTYAAPEFQVDTPAMMAPPSSGQDYDMILHSQGTWEEQNYADGGAIDIKHAVPKTEPVDNVPLLEDIPVVLAAEAACGIEDKVVQDEASSTAAPPVIEDNALLNDEQGQPPPLLEDASKEENSPSNPAVIMDAQMGSAEMLHNPTDPLPDIQNHHVIQTPPTEAMPVLEPDPSGSRTPSKHGEDSTLALDYNNGPNSDKQLILQGDAGYVYGHITSATESNPTQQSYSYQMPDLGAAAMLQPDLTHQEPLPSIPVGENQPLPSLDILSNEEAPIAHVENPESPIPADGLHPRQSEPSYSDSPHHFASPNSAFESRIRSQSTGSNNSNASSQRSANNQPLQIKYQAQNRVAVPPYSAASMEAASSSRQETIPTSNPFSTNTMHSSHVSDHSSSQPLTTAPPVQSAIPPIPDIVRPLPSGSADEGLRTGATAPLPFTNQSLHSQVLRNRTAYPPEPVAAAPPPAAATSGRPQPDLIQSPPENANVQLRTSAEVSHTVMALKTSDPPPQSRPDVSAASTSGVSASVNSDPYLSRSLHNSHSDLVPPDSRSHDSVPRLSPVVHSHPNELEQSPESSLPLSSRTDDLRQRDVDDRHHPERRKHDEDSRYSEERDRNYRRGTEDTESRRGSKDSRWDDYRRHEDDYRRRDYDDRYSQSGRLDSRDDRYRDGRYDDSARSRPDYNSRPSSRPANVKTEQEQMQSSHPDYYSRHYDDRHDHRDYRDPYYRDRYYNDRYQAYENRPYYGYDDRANDRYYDQYHGRYYDSWHDRSRHYQDQYYYDSYYRDYGYRDQRHPDEEDSRSMYSEKSRATEQDPAAERERDWHARHGYYDQYEGYDRSYGHKYYEDSLADESTLSNAYDESLQSLPHVPSRQTPAKFTTTHTLVRFGPGGQLIKVPPNRPTDNQPSTVEIHSLEILLQNTTEAEDLRSYRGPLTKDDTHKNDVLQFASVQSTESMKDVDLTDRRSTALIWDFLALLVRQNGSVLGTDIAELLTKDHSGDFTLMQSPLEASRQRQLQLQRRTATPNSISDDQGGSASPAPEQSETKSTVSTLSAEIAPTMERNTSRFRELLLHGRKKDALEWAMKSSLWGHALLLASKTDSRTHAQVMLRFANSLPINDPLQTVYQLMSGRQPAAATCVSEEGWGDWRPHLAMMLSNPTSSASLDMRAVLTMGDTLSSRGLLHAAHFCYLMSSTPLGYYGRTTSKMVLLGGNHLLPFTEFASWDSIRRTEIYEYAISLGKPQRSGSNSAPAALPAFQLYKLIYACKLAEYGLVAQAFHYCERIAKAVCRSPSSYSATLVNQLLNISDQLRHHDPQIQAGVSEASNLRWLETLRTINVQIQSGAIVPRTNVTSSLLTTSNTPSVVSTSPTTDSQNDEIRFSAHTPDQDDSEDVTDSGAPPPQNHPQQMYNQSTPQVTMYSSGVPGTQDMNASQPMTTDMGLQQQMPPTYTQEQNQIPMHDPNAPAMQYNQQQPQFMQPSVPTYAQPQVPMGNFDRLANQANPLAPAISYQHQNSYGFTQEQQHPLTPAEEAEKAEHYDYYDKMANTHTTNYGRGGSFRSRTISQSSQRSRGSTIKGYDRTTPTGMLNNADKGRRSRTTSENSAGRRSRKTSGEPHSKPQKEETEEPGVKKSGSWSLFGWLSRRRSNQVHLPDDSNKEIVWDNDKHRWVNKNATEEENAPPAPPPMDNALANPPQAAPMQPMLNQNGSASQPVIPNSGEGQLTANRFSLKNLGNRSMYKNAFSTSSKPVAAPAPLDLMPGLQNSASPKPTGFMIPNPVPTSQPSNVQDPVPAAASTPMHGPDTTQSIQSSAVAAAPESDNAPPGPTMFFNPSQLPAQPDLLSQPSGSLRRGNALTRRGRGRPGYPR